VYLKGHKIMTNTIENTGVSTVLALSNQLADGVERINKSLVLVNGRQRQPASGIIIGADLVLTADHVLEREEDITIVTADKRTLPAQFVGRDLSSDLAVLRVADLNGEAATASAQPARVGQFVLTVGRPSEEGPMASVGIVSAVGGPLNLGRGLTLEKYIRTDAIPYPGFSGGALIDASGAVLGVLTTGLVGGLALIVPTEVAWRIGDTLAKHGYIKRGYLGISSQPVAIPEGQRAGQDQTDGLLIVRVEDKSPAQQAGLLVGDILLTFNGKVVNDAETLQAALSGDLVGQAAPAQIIRGGNVQTVQLTVGQRS
jgi:S1-C subfamily serine protease